jgi:hypothetical protein
MVSGKVAKLFSVAIVGLVVLAAQGGSSASCSGSSGT